MVIFFVIVLVKPLRDLFALAELGPLELGIAILFATLWLFLARWLWRKNVFARYLSAKAML